MNIKISQYIEILFKNAPNNQNIFDLKSRLIETMSKKYENYLAEGFDEITSYNMIAKDLKNVDDLIKEANSSYNANHPDNCVESIFDFCLNTELREEQIFEANVEEIVVDNISYSVGIDCHNNDEILVQYYSSKNNPTNEFIAEVTNGILRIKQKNQHKIIFGALGKIIIKVPSHRIYRYNLNTISGTIVINAESTNLVTKTVSGGVKILKTGDNLKCSTTSGGVKVYNPFDNMNIDVVSGGIKIAIGEKTHNVKLGTVSGGIRIALRDNVGYTICSSTVLGRIKNNYINGMDKNTKGCIYGNGQVQISASTVSGSIRLEEW